MRFRIIGYLMVALAVSGCSTKYGSINEPQSTPPPPSEPAPPPVKPSGTVQDDMGQIAGEAVGGTIDRNLSPDDRQKLQAATQKALETGDPGIPTKWRNAASGAYGSITPQPIFPMNGASCREFQQHVNAGGEMATGYGTACRDRRGIWRIAENG
jgi:surface antigen